MGYIVEQSSNNLDKDLVVYMPLANRTPTKGQNIKTIQEALKQLPGGDCRK